jgi:hypothetical protein
MATLHGHQNKLGGDTNHLMVRKEGSSVYKADAPHISVASC